MGMGGFIVTNDVLILGTLSVGLGISIGINAALLFHAMRLSSDLSKSVEGLTAAARWMEAGLRPAAEENQ